MGVTNCENQLIDKVAVQRIRPRNDRRLIGQIRVALQAFTKRVAHAHPHTSSYDEVACSTQMSWVFEPERRNSSRE